MRRYCSTIGCTAIVDKGRCPLHQSPVSLGQRRHYTGKGVNYGRPWQRETRPFLAEHVWCVLCPPGSMTLAVEVDHIIPHEGDAGLFWDPANWQPVCRACHEAKTRVENRQRRMTAI